MNKAQQTKLINAFAMAAISLAIGIMVHKYVYHHPSVFKSAFSVIGGGEGEEDASPSRTSCGL